MRWLSKLVRTRGNILRVLWLISILILAYIGWMNLVPLGGTTTHFIDVGGEDTDGSARITESLQGISDRKEVSGTSFREFGEKLVYFEFEDPRLGDADEIGVRVRFQDNFPEDAEFT